MTVRRIAEVTNDVTSPLLTIDEATGTINSGNTPINSPGTSAPTGAAHTVLAGPTSGGPATMTARALAVADLPATTDGTLAANSDTLVPTEKAVKTYVDATHGTFKVVTHLTAAQLLALKLTPRTVIPAVPAGQMVRPVGFTVQYKFNTTPYTVGGGDNLEFRYIGDTMPLCDVAATGLLDQGASTTSQQYAVSPLTMAQTMTDGKGVEVVNTGAAEWTGGDDDIWITALYELITLN